MPNGDPDIDYYGMEEFFAPIADAIHEFAVRRNLHLEKYYHDGRNWALWFNHPAGGQASIHLLRDQSDGLRVSSAWWYDDYEQFTRFSHVRQLQECPCDPPVVTQKLEDELKGIVAVKFGDWNQRATGYQRIWGMHSKDEFEAMRRQPEFPNPRIDDPV